MALITIGNNFLYLFDNIESTPNKYSKESHYNKGNSQFSKGKYKQAIKEYDKALEIDSDFDLASFNKSIALMLTAKFVEVLSIYQTLLGKHKIIKESGKIENAELLYNIALNNYGVALLLIQKYDDALQCFEELVSASGGNIDELAYLHMANALLGLNRYKEALESIDKVTKINEKNHIALFIKGNILFWLKKYEGAIENYNKAIELNDELIEAYRNKSKTYSAMEEHSKAVETLEDVLEKKPNTQQLLVDIGNIYLIMEKYDDAINYYDKFLEIEPESKFALNYKLVALFKQEKYEDTLKCVEKILEIDPNDKEALERKSLITNLLNKQKEIKQQETSITSVNKKKLAQKIPNDDTKNEENITTDVTEMTLKEARENYKGLWVVFKKNDDSSFGNETIGKVLLYDKDYKTFNKMMEKNKPTNVYCFYAENE